MEKRLCKRKSLPCSRIIWGLHSPWSWGWSIQRGCTSSLSSPLGSSQDHPGLLPATGIPLTTCTAQGTHSSCPCSALTPGKAGKPCQPRAAECLPAWNTAARQRSRPARAPLSFSYNTFHCSLPPPRNVKHLHCYQGILLYIPAKIIGDFWKYT